MTRRIEQDEIVFSGNVRATFLEAMQKPYEWFTLVGLTTEDVANVQHIMAGFEGLGISNKHKYTYGQGESFDMAIMFFPVGG